MEKNCLPVFTNDDYYKRLEELVPGFYKYDYCMTCFSVITRLGQRYMTRTPLDKVYRLNTTSSNDCYEYIDREDVSPICREQCNECDTSHIKKRPFLYF